MRWSLSEPGDASSGRELYNRDCALGEPSGADTRALPRYRIPRARRFYVTALSVAEAVHRVPKKMCQVVELLMLYLINTEKCARTRKVPNAR